MKSKIKKNLDMFTFKKSWVVAGDHDVVDDADVAAVEIWTWTILRSVVHITLE